MINQPNDVGCVIHNYKDSRNWMWDDHVPQKTRLWTLAHVVLPVGFCEIRIQLNHPKSHGISSHWWFQTHQPTSLKSRATFRGGSGGGLGKKPLIFRAERWKPHVIIFSGDFSRLHAWHSAVWRLQLLLPWRLLWWRRESTRGRVGGSSIYREDSPWIF